jgi:hypothetical protein
MATAKKVATKAAGVNKGGRPRKYATDAERQAAYRARNDTVRLTVDLPRELVEGLNAYMKFKGLTKTEVFSKLLKSQLLRKR